MNKRLYVGNLSYQTTEATLSNLFGAIGEVISVDLITDRMTGRSRGFAFVEMAEQSAAQEAINQLNGKTVDGRDIKVAEAHPRRSTTSRVPLAGDAACTPGAAGTLCQLSIISISSCAHITDTTSASRLRWRAVD